MLIDDIDLADFYRKRLQLTNRTEKKSEHWDKRAGEVAENCAPLIDSYLLQLLGKVDLKGAESLFDMDYGPSTVSLALTRKMPIIYSVDYSQGVLDVAACCAAQMSAHHVQWVQWAQKEHRDDLPQCDIAAASRFTLVADIRQAMTKLNNQTRLRVCTTHLVNSSFVSSAIQRALGREVIELPNYIYAPNVLYQTGIHTRVDFIRGPSCQQDNSTWTRFLENTCWSMGGLSTDGAEHLETWYRQQDPRTVAPANRDWALIQRDSIPREALR